MPLAPAPSLSPPSPELPRRGRMQRTHGGAGNGRSTGLRCCLRPRSPPASSTPWQQQGRKLCRLFCLFPSHTSIHYMHTYTNTDTGAYIRCAYVCMHVRLRILCVHQLRYAYGTDAAYSQSIRSNMGKLPKKNTPNKIIDYVPKLIITDSRLVLKINARLID
jgi:hypothetical protein